MPLEVVETDSTTRCKGTGEKRHEQQVDKWILKKRTPDVPSNLHNPAIAVWGTTRTVGLGWHQDLCAVPRDPEHTDIDLI